MGLNMEYGVGWEPRWMGGRLCYRPITHINSLGRRGVGEDGRCGGGGGLIAGECH
jgi:hypothetical protein